MMGVQWGREISGRSLLGSMCMLKTLKGRRPADMRRDSNDKHVFQRLSCHKLYILFKSHYYVQSIHI